MYPVDIHQHLSYYCNWFTSDTKINRELEKITLKGYTKKVDHASEIKVIMEKHKNERLLVLGGGETASDICMEWLDHAWV